MKTLTEITTFAGGMPPQMVLELGRIEVGRGREELHRTQAPQVLERLAVQTRYESITASSAIENVIVPPERALHLVRPGGPARARDRSERELAGYRDAVDHLVRGEGGRLDLDRVLQLHRLLMRHVDGASAGRLKAEDNLIADRLAQGGSSVVFRAVPAGQTERQMSVLLGAYEAAVDDAVVHPLVLVAALVLDLLSIHPFADGNGRVARLVTTGELLRHGYGIARYVSLEQRIYDTRNSYYRALRQSQAGWHDGRHDLWPWAGYLFSLLSDAYDDFEARVLCSRALHGATKEEHVRDYALNHAPERFSFAQVSAALPDISGPTIRNALNRLRAEGRLAVGRGRSARWTRLPEKEPAI
ncbi:MAG: Fic family protein [Thermoleophilia bacterium]